MLYCTVLYCTALYCTDPGGVLYCTVSKLLYCEQTTVLYCTVLYCTVLTQVVYELYPGIMESLKAINFKVSWSRVPGHAAP